MKTVKPSIIELIKDISIMVLIAIIIWHLLPYLAVLYRYLILFNVNELENYVRDTKIVYCNNMNCLQRQLSKGNIYLIVYVGSRCQEALKLMNYRDIKALLLFVDNICECVRALSLIPIKLDEGIYRIYNVVLPLERNVFKGDIKRPFFWSLSEKVCLIMSQSGKSIPISLAFYGDELKGAVSIITQTNNKTILLAPRDLFNRFKIEDVAISINWISFLADSIPKESTILFYFEKPALEELFHEAKEAQRTRSLELIDIFMRLMRIFLTRDLVGIKLVAEIPYSSLIYGKCIREVLLSGLPINESCRDVNPEIFMFSYVNVLGKVIEHRINR